MVTTRKIAARVRMALTACGTGPELLAAFNVVMGSVDLLAFSMFQSQWILLCRERPHMTSLGHTLTFGHAVARRSAEWVRPAGWCCFPGPRTPRPRSTSPTPPEDHSPR